MKFKYDFYHKDANAEGTAEALAWLNDFYTRYPTGLELGEALHQYRREHNLIQEIEKKRKTVAKIQQELDDE